VAVATPPVGDHAVREDDQIARVLAAVDLDAPELVVAKYRHALIVDATR
jgi:hypothetical protein